MDTVPTISSSRTRLTEAVRNSDAVAEVRVGRGLLADLPHFLRTHGADGSVCLFADANTWRAAGEQAHEILRGAGWQSEPFILPGRPRVGPDRRTGDELRAFLAGRDHFLVAVGSGVLNDLAKYAAFQLERPYVVVATAASMDGYTSAGSPLSEDGFKITLPCRPARAVLGDLGILAEAPAEMNGWGFGDLAGKLPAGADWILADALGIEPVDPVAWALVQEDLPQQLSRPAEVAAGNPSAVEELFCGLNLVGLAMERHGSSRPASGADHQIAHLWEMEGLSLNGEKVSHGACVSVATVAMLRLYRWWLRQDLRDVVDGVKSAPPTSRERELALLHSLLPDPAIASRAEREFAPKLLSPAERTQRLVRLQQEGVALQEKVRDQLDRIPDLAERLAQAGAPFHPSQIGIDGERLRHTVRAARFLRSRYTLLDLLAEMGQLDRAIDASLRDD
jgi:glycerol-1-phosphate dehydrogenase [NAD(P)+]